MAVLPRPASGRVRRPGPPVGALEPDERLASLTVDDARLLWDAYRGWLDRQPDDPRLPADRVERLQYARAALRREALAEARLNGYTDDPGPREDAAVAAALRAIGSAAWSVSAAAGEAARDVTLASLLRPAIDSERVRELMAPFEEGWAARARGHPFDILALAAVVLSILAVYSVDSAGGPLVAVALLAAAIGALVLRRRARQWPLPPDPVEPDLSAPDASAPKDPRLPADMELFGPVRNDPVAVEPYDAAWPRRFEEYRQQLAEALGPTARRIDHVGSTAVPGLAAKPVIDIQVSVPDADDEAAFVDPIETVAGLGLRSREPGHRYFRPVPPHPRLVQVHVSGAGSKWVRDHLLFRDYLRAHPDRARAYGELKVELARLHAGDRIGYTEAKSAFIGESLELAEPWAVETGWRP